MTGMHSIAPYTHMLCLCLFDTDREVLALQHRVAMASPLLLLLARSES